MANVRVQAVFQGGSGLAEDRFINTFHFSDGNPATIYDAVAPNCRNRVMGFYEDLIANAPLGNYMSEYVSRTYTVTSYNLTLPPGERVPTSETSTIAATSSGGLPEEVCIVLSLRGAPPHTPRRRGRIYFGPLCNQSTILVEADATTNARPALTGPSNIGQALTAAATALTVPIAEMAWCIRSVTPTENFVPIESGYVDDAFDTQRRRGPDPSTRIFFTAS